LQQLQRYEWNVSSIEPLHGSHHDFLKSDYDDAIALKLIDKGANSAD